jgi:DNA-binding GntR family transcriptional regulator
MTAVPDQASKADLVHRRLKEEIELGELAPGTPLSELSLVERTGASRTPVREALRRLADEGLVAIYPRRGMVVAPVDVRDLASICEVRAEMEGFAAGLAAVRATGRDRDEADALVSDLQRLPEESDERALIRFDQRVHHFVHRCTHNAYLQDTLGSYLTLSLRLWFVGLDQVSRLDEAIREHREMLQSISDGDGDRAAAVARAHVTGFQREIGRVISAGS